MCASYRTVSVYCAFSTIRSANGNPEVSIGPAGFLLHRGLRQQCGVVQAHTRSFQRRRRLYRLSAQIIGLRGLACPKHFGQAYFAIRCAVKRTRHRRDEARPNTLTDESLPVACIASKAPTTLQRPQVRKDPQQYSSGHRPPLSTTARLKGWGGWSKYRAPTP